MPQSAKPPDQVDPREPCTYRPNVTIAAVLYQESEGCDEDIACTLKKALFGSCTRSFAVYDVGFFLTFLLAHSVPVASIESMHVFADSEKTGYEPRTGCLVLISRTTVTHLRTGREVLPPQGRTADDGFAHDVTDWVKNIRIDRQKEAYQAPTARPTATT